MGIFSGKKKEKHYTPKAKSWIFVSGVDDLSDIHDIEHSKLIQDANQAVKKTIPNVEEGSILNGVIAVRSPIYPTNPIGLVKFILQGKYLYREIHTYHTTTYTTDAKGHRQAHRQVHHKTTNHKKKWCKHKIKVVIQPLALPNCQLAEDGSFILLYPFSFAIPTGLSDSFSIDRHGHQQCWYNLKCKLKMDGKFIKVKSMKRDIDICEKRPTIEQLTTKPAAGKDKHKSYTGGDATSAAVNVSAFIFMEGQQVILEASIENKSSKPIMKADVELEEVCHYPEHHTGDGGDYWKENSHKFKLSHHKLKGLEIAENSEKFVKFALDIPEIIEPPSTSFSYGHHYLRVEHFAYLHLDVKHAKDVRVHLPVLIAPNPARYLVSLPYLPPQQLDYCGTVPTADFVVPSGYVVAAAEPPAVPMGQQLLGPRLLQFTLVSATDLPKMDLVGGADPFATIWINGVHVRTSHTVHNTRSPEFNEKFNFFLNPCEDLATGELCVYLALYDYDHLSSDDKIGAFELRVRLEELAALADDTTKSLLLQHKKKGELERGSVTFRMNLY